MALTVIPVASSGAGPIQISVNNNIASGAVMYTVPAGRKFVGRIWNTGNNNQTQINSTYMYCYFGSATSVAQSGSLWEYNLVAGTVIKEGTANTSAILGIESAA